MGHEILPSSAKRVVGRLAASLCAGLLLCAPLLAFSAKVSPGFEQPAGAAVAAAVPEEPPESKNPLVRRIVQMLRSEEAFSHDEIIQVLTIDIEQSTNRLAMFRSLLEVIEQYSVETIAGAQAKLSTGMLQGYDRRHAGSGLDRYIEFVADPNLAAAGFAGPETHLGPFGAVFAQLHRLSPPEFEIFAREFVAALVRSQGRLSELNRLVLWDAIKTRRAVEASKAPDAPAGKAVLRGQTVSAGVRRQFEVDGAIHRTFGSLLLEQAFEWPLMNLGDIRRAGADADAALQIQRILVLVGRVLRETNVLAKRQREIRDNAARYLSMGVALVGEHDAEARFIQEIFGDPAIRRELRAIVGEGSAIGTRSCSGLFAGR